MNILVIDVGGTHVKILASREREKREIESGPTMTAQQMVSSVKELAGDLTMALISRRRLATSTRRRPCASYRPRPLRR
jgi:polyphosphate glucokinase